MSLIRKNSSILHRCVAACSKNSIFLPSSHFLPSFSLSTFKAEAPSPKTPFIVKYLIDSVGLSSAEAIRASKFLTHVKSPSNPNSVLEFFRKNGFTDADIKRIICHHSRVLCSMVDSTLKPKFEVLRDLGFSDTQITKLITANPVALNYISYCNVRPRIDFLSAFLRSHDHMVKAFSVDRCFLASSLEKTIKPNIAFLRECQFSNERIGMMLLYEGRFVGRDLKSLKFIAKRVDELGVLRESWMFYPAFCCLSGVSSDTVDAKIKLLASLGFSTSDLSLALARKPSIFALSEKNLRDTIDFLVSKVGCKISYVSRYPTILGLSLTKRLIPRNYVMQLIMKKGLLKKKIDFYRSVSISEKKFLEKFIFSFQKEMPELPDVYLSASAALLAKFRRLK